jgi:hypothetical protein
MPWSTERLPDGPSLVRALAQALLDRTPARGGVVDLSDALVLVPASRARRALERHLFAMARERGVAAIAPHVVTPGGLAGRLVVPRRRLVGALVARAAWTAALVQLPDAVAAPLFPEAGEGGARSARAMAAVARRAAALHRDCVAAGIGFRDVAEHVRRTMPESDPARWDALAALSAARDRLLAAADAADPGSEAVAAVDSGAIHAGALRRAFVLLADPEPLQRRLLRALAAGGVDVTVCVHAAGEELPAPLDAEGFPDHAAWQRAAIAVPDQMILLAGTPAHHGDRDRGAGRRRRPRGGDAAAGVGRARDRTSRALRGGRARRAPRGRARRLDGRAHLRCALCAGAPPGRRAMACRARVRRRRGADGHLRGIGRAHRARITGAPGLRPHPPRRRVP